MNSNKNKNPDYQDQNSVVKFQETGEVDKYFQEVNLEVEVLVNLHLRVAVDYPLSLVSMK